MSLHSILTLHTTVILVSNVRNGIWSILILQSLLCESIHSLKCTNPIYTLTKCAIPNQSCIVIKHIVPVSVVKYYTFLLYALSKFTPYQYILVILFQQAQFKIQYKELQRHCCRLTFSLIWYMGSPLYISTYLNVVLARNSLLVLMQNFAAYTAAYTGLKYVYSTTCSPNYIVVKFHSGTDIIP